MLRCDDVGARAERAELTPSLGHCPLRLGWGVPVSGLAPAECGAGLRDFSAVIPLPAGAESFGLKSAVQGLADAPAPSTPQSTSGSESCGECGAPQLRATHRPGLPVHLLCRLPPATTAAAAAHRPLCRASLHLHGRSLRSGDCSACYRRWMKRAAVLRRCSRAVALSGRLHLLPPLPCPSLQQALFLSSAPSHRSFASSARAAKGKNTFGSNEYRREVSPHCHSSRLHLSHSLRAPACAPLPSPSPTLSLTLSHSPSSAASATVARSSRSTTKRCWSRRGTSLRRSPHLRPHQPAFPPPRPPLQRPSLPSR